MMFSDGGGEGGKEREKGRGMEGKGEREGGRGSE